MSEVSLEVRFGVERLEPLGFQLSPGLVYDEWIHVGEQLGRAAKALPWLVGDWLVFGQFRFGEMYADAERLTGLDYQTLANCKTVAGRFQFSRRRETLSFAHHAEVAAEEEDEQELWLALAEEKGWNVKDLRYHRRERKALGNGSEPAWVVFVRLSLVDEEAERITAAAAERGVSVEAWLHEAAAEKLEREVAGRDREAA